MDVPVVPPASILTCFVASEASTNVTLESVNDLFVRVAVCDSVTTGETVVPSWKPSFPVLSITSKSPLESAVEVVFGLIVIPDQNFLNEKFENQDYICHKNNPEYKKYKILAKVIYEDFKIWCQVNSFNCIGLKTFYLSIEKKGYKKDISTGKQNYIFGICSNEPSSSSSFLPL